MPHSRPLLTAALLLLLALTGSTLAEQLKVVSISDGDTFTGLDSENRQVKVRLHGIDAPEKAQAFGNVSRKALGDLIEGKTVEGGADRVGVRVLVADDIRRLGGAGEGKGRRDGRHDDDAGGVGHF